MGWGIHGRDIKSRVLMGPAYSGSTMPNPLWRSKVSSAERATQLAWYSQNEILLHSLANTRKVLIVQSFLPNFALFLFVCFPSLPPLYKHAIYFHLTWILWTLNDFFLIRSLCFLSVQNSIAFMIKTSKQESLVFPPFLILSPMLNFIRTIFSSNVHNLSSLDCYQLWERTFPRQDIRSGKLGI